MDVAFSVHGRVQGVGYRSFARDRARELDLSGWVRNAYDGTVMGEASGDPSALETFREWLTRGPSMARVSRVDWSIRDGRQWLPFPFEVRR